MSVPDLGQLKPVPPELAAEAMGAAELQWGLRCMSCAERIVDGVHLHLIEPVHSENGVSVQRVRLAYCDREGCRGAIEHARKQATFEERVSYRWLDEGDPPS